VNRQKLGKKHFLEAIVSIAIAIVFIIPVSSMVATFESESISDDTTIGIEPDTMQMVKKGETFNISIHVVPSEPVICVNVGNLSFNSSLIHANAVTEGNLFDTYETFTPGSIDNVDGNINGIEGTANTSNATTDAGFLCNISFTAQEEIGTSVLDIEGVVVTNLSGITISSTIKNDGLVTVVAWSVVLRFSEIGGIREDNVVFGEMPDANDGPPADIYDEGKPSPPFPPYLYIWFDDNLPMPNNFLWKDYRSYPDTYKVWNLYAKWDSLDSTHVSVAISWDNSTFYGCEYDFVVLWRYDPFDMEWDFAADMLISNNYVYVPRWFNEQWLTDNFQIITRIFDISPPDIINMTLTPSDPIDTDVPYGWENISCTVIDMGVGINQVKLVVTNATATVEYMMANIPGTDVYYYNTTFMQPGNYSYHIWATDLILNTNVTTDEQFVLPPNWEMNDDRKCDISDLRKVSLQFGETGPDGWIRADYNNDGICDISDLRKVALCFGDTY